MTKRKIKNKSKIIKSLVLLFVIGILDLFCHLDFYICHSTAYAQDKIIAVVNSDIITQRDLDDFLNFMRMQLSVELKGEELESRIQSMKLDLLNRLIEDRLIFQEAKKLGMVADESRIRARIDEMKRHYTSDAAFQKAISRQGLTQADLESRIKEQLLMYSAVDVKVRSKIMINPGEVTEFYEKNKETIKIPEQRQVISIAIGQDEGLAQEIYRKLQKDQDLEGILAKYSFITNEITVTENGELRKDIEETIFKLNSGQASKPEEINGTFYIFKLQNIISPQQQSLSEAQESIHTYLFEEKMQTTLKLWMDELKKQAYIKIS